MNIDDISNKMQILNGTIKKNEGVKNDLLEKVGGTEKQSFKDLLSGFVGDVNKLQKEADTSVNKLASGEITDVHDVMVKVEEANLSFSLMMELRNKLIEGYKEVMKTNV